MSATDYWLMVLHNDLRTFIDAFLFVFGSLTGIFFISAVRGWK